jgi:dihydroneopterin aldolase/2-amino-4-hydroxy-6-hydroxymethyldihydropteridine diphosphokinase
MNPHTVYIGIGTNLGDKKSNISKAVHFINSDLNCRILKSSSIYEASPYGFEHSSDFLNAVLKLETDYTLHELFNFLKSIEKKMGRKKTDKWEAREIDLDILLYDDITHSDEVLTVPHKGITERDFVLMPLIELEPGLIHPELKEKIADISIKHLKKNIIKKLPEKLF